MSTTTLLEDIRNAIVGWKGTVGSPLSLADVSKIARVEPITLISSDLARVPELYTILHGVLNVYAAYYLQAISILSAQLHDVRILQILDRTNPDRDLRTLLTTQATAWESYKAPVPDKHLRTMDLAGCAFALPMLDSDRKAALAGESGTWDKYFDQKKEGVLSTSVKRVEVFERLGMGIGKVVEVEFKSTETTGSGNKVTDRTRGTSVMVVVKLDTSIVPTEVIRAIVTNNMSETTFLARTEDMIKGRIDFIQDYLLCSDLVRNYKKVAFKDNTQQYNNMLKRINNSRLFSAISGNISVAAVSAIVVLSSADEEEICKRLGSKLSSKKIRELVFENTMAMMLVCINQDYERVSIWIRDIDGESQCSFEAFKDQASKNNNQIADIFKAFNMGNAPRF